tara:strand:- start:12901 stop:13224 length:324 start_codon:yes stop_codon:yes gene_type:complete
MELEDTLMAVIQAILLLAVTVVGYFIRRLIDRSDQMEAEMMQSNFEFVKQIQKSETDTNKSINKVRERAIHLEAKSESNEEKLLELKQKLDSMGTDIVWIREKLASR